MVLKELQKAERTKPASPEAMEKADGLHHDTGNTEIGCSKVTLDGPGTKLPMLCKVPSWWVRGKMNISLQVQ